MSMGLFYFTRQKFTMYVRKLNMTVNDFSINLEVLTFINQNFLN